MNKSLPPILEADRAPLLRLRDVASSYGVRPVLHGLSLEVFPGEVVALLGLNGAGKTTTLRTIMGYLTPTRGSIELHSEPIAGKSPQEITRLGISWVPQEGSIFPFLTVEEHLQLGGWTVPRRERAERIAAMYDFFPHLWKRRRQVARTLSGGERQMLSLARALMTDPQLLLLDEPSLGLAPRIVDTVFERLAEIRRRGTSILLVEQNAAKALAYSDRAYIMEMGRIKESGPSPQLATDPRIRRAYLGG